MIINSLYDVDIVVNGVTLMNKGYASGLKCIITEDVTESIPSCTLEFLSSGDFLDNLAVVDGTPIMISIDAVDPLLNSKKVYNFRVSKLTAFPRQQTYYYKITGLLDCYEMFRSAAPYAQNSSSSDLFKAVATKNNLSAVIHPTNDKQLWVASEQNLGKWLSNVAMHGWASSTSGMLWFMDKEGVLNYIDIDRQIFESSEPVVFSPGRTTIENIEDTKIINFSSFSMQTRSGEENLFNNGYGGENRYFSTVSYDWNSFNPNQVRASSNIVNINKELSQGLEENFCEFDTGNYHSNYFLARDQNLRVLSTYSTYITLSCDLFRDIHLGQVGTIKSQSDISQRQDTTANQKNIINRIDTIITNRGVSMQVTLCEQGYDGTSTESY